MLLALSRFSPHFSVFQAYPLLALGRFSPYFPVFQAYPLLALSRFSPYASVSSLPFTGSQSLFTTFSGFKASSGVILLLTYHFPSTSF